MRTSTDTAPPPPHRLDHQPDQLIASSDVNWPLNGDMDQDQAKLPSQPKIHLETSNATEGHTEIKPVKDNKAVPW